MRQQNGLWTTAWQNEDLLAQGVSLMLADFRAIGLSTVRWVVSLECDDRILSAEFHPRFHMPKLSLMARTFGHRRLGAEDIEVSVAEYLNILDQETQKRLYRVFGIPEVLFLNRRYEYPAHVLQQGRQSQPEPLSS